MKKRIKYNTELPKQLYVYFLSYSEPGVPSFDKFARSIGITLENINEFRRHKEFERAYRECNEIRRDYLIDAALTKRFDSSFSKFLLTSEYGMGEKEKEESDSNINVILEVLGAENGD